MMHEFPYTRPLSEKFLSLLAGEPGHMLFCSGPRQSGKTTLIRQVLDQCDCSWLYVSADDFTFETSVNEYGPQSASVLADDWYAKPPESPIIDNDDTAWLARSWELARELANAKDGRFVFVIDEVQHIPEWARFVKGMWDADQRRGHRLHVVMLGSAPLLMQEGMANYLTGRFRTIHVPHWSFSEMRNAFGLSLDEYIYYGGYPGGAAKTGDFDQWYEYVQNTIVGTSIEREILAMQQINKPVLMESLLTVGAGYSGQILSYNKMLGQLQDAGNTTTLARYLKLLSDVGLLTGLPKHSNRAYVRKASTPKLNVLNTALMSAGSGHELDGAKDDKRFWGRLVESAVGAHLLNSGNSRIEVSYWRHNNYEVDFVVKYGRRLLAVEVKSGLNQRGFDMKGLKAFNDNFGPAKSLAVGQAGIPVEDFLSAPVTHWFED